MTANGSPTPTERRRPLAVPGEAPHPTAVVRSATSRADTVIRGLQSSPSFGLVVQVDRSHQRDCTGRVSTHSELVHLASLINPYPLDGQLFCRCGSRFSRWGLSDSTREYMALCGCRLRPIDAETIECRVYADAVRRDPVSATGWSEAPGEVLAHLYTRIEVGGTVDDVRFVPRT